jgi:hypothetical protein
VDGGDRIDLVEFGIYPGPADCADEGRRRRQDNGEVKA